MPIEPNGPAPYAPPSAFLTFMAAVRDRDLPTPYTADVISRAGVTEALAPRVLKTLKLFDLIGGDDEPTDQLHDVARAGSAEYKARLADVLQSAYGDVFRYVDPAKDSAQDVADQFRSYTPRGQRDRMVTLFLGLCEFVELAPVREREAKPRSTRKSRPAPPKKPKASTPPEAKTPRVGEVWSPPTPNSGSKPFIDGLIAQLPEAGANWSKAKRKAWTDAALAIFDLIYELPPEKEDG